MRVKPVRIDVSLRRRGRKQHAEGNADAVVSEQGGDEQQISK